MFVGAEVTRLTSSSKPRFPEEMSLVTSAPTWILNFETRSQLSRRAAGCQLTFALNEKVRYFSTRLAGAARTSCFAGIKLFRLSRALGF